METGRGLFSESAEFKRQAEERRKEINQSNALLDPPSDLSADERRVWKEIATLITSSTNYKKNYRRRGTLAAILPNKNYARQGVGGI